ncbi:MAG: ribonuclease R [Bacteroidetes bacterium]|nr:ribonuclease R [Bacteroidota bacterium]
MPRKKHKKHSKKEANIFLQGRLDMTRSGIGYVVIADKSGDVLVRQGDFHHAFHGDLVKVQITKINVFTGKREGKISSILERKQMDFTGVMQVKKGIAFFVPSSEKQKQDFFIPPENMHGAKDGDRVIAKFIQWDKKAPSPVGEITAILKDEDANEVAMQQIIIENGFTLKFPEPVLHEAEKIQHQISKKEFNKRKDCRELLTFTIDPIDAKDFDDAISLHRNENGNLEVGVHIADVSHYLQEGSAMDKEGYLRATSVYLPDRVIPMLPEKISNDLCSLRPNEDKLTFSILFEINKKAEIKKTWIGKTIIHSNHRFTYEEVQDILDQKKGLHVDELLELNTIAQLLRKNRFDHGAINFSSEDVRFKLDEHAKPVAVIIKENKEAHQLIEEFMLLANRTVASFVSEIKVNKKPVPFPYRVHDTPDEQKLLPFVSFAKKFGYHFDITTPEKTAHSYNKMLQASKGKPEQHVLEQLGIRTMAKAAYTTQNIGHYGLGFQNYCHFTSPIRRFPDILVHRIIHSLLEKKPLPDQEMDEKCRHCSAMERAAMESERAAHKYKQVEFMQEYVGEEFDAIISGVASFGIFAETTLHKCEGMISLSSLLEYDDFSMLQNDYCLEGKYSGKKFRIGDEIHIRVIAAHLEKRQLDYEWVAPSMPQSKKNKKVKLQGKKGKKNN